MKRIFVVLVMAILIANQAFAYRGMIKPVDVKNDDDTNDGVAGTGQFYYAVIWRGPYVGTEGQCYTQGMGRHGGVDIGTSGKSIPVYAPCDAYIDFTAPHNFVAGNNNGWGGTAILYVADIPGLEPVYVSFHHLREYNPAIVAKKNLGLDGIWVSIGTWLGNSGGGINDPMNGSSTGRHTDFRCMKAAIRVNSWDSALWYPSWPSWVVDDTAQRVFGGDDKSQVNIPDSWVYYRDNYKTPANEALFSFPPQNQQDYEVTVPPVSNFTYDPMKLIQSRLVKVGEKADGTIVQKIVDCFNRNGGFTGVGQVFADNGTLDNWNPAYAHNWEPTSYQCQNFCRGNGEKSVIIHDSVYGSQAYRLSGEIWEKYRKGKDGHFGPDYRLANGKILGCPFTEENGVVWFGERGERRGYFNEKLELVPAKSGEETYTIAIKVYQTDGTLIETYYPTGEFSALTLIAQPMSQNHNALAWLGGPVASSYRVLADLRLKRLFDILNLA